MSLTEFLTNIASAIRDKKGSTDLIYAQNFAEEINNLSAGDELIDEYEVNNTTTSSIVFDNLNIVQGELYYLHAENLNGNYATVSLGMSVNELVGSSTGYSSCINFATQTSGTHYYDSTRSSYGILGITRNSNDCFLKLTSEGLLITSLGEDFIVGARFYDSDSVPSAITKIILYGDYAKNTTPFSNGTKIQLYKKVGI